MNRGPTGTLKPFRLAKTIKKIRVNSSHHSKGHRIPPGRTQLRHVIKVHAIDTHDHCRDGHKRNVSGQTLGDFALPQGDEGQIDGIWPWSACAACYRWIGWDEAGDHRRHGNNLA